MSEPFIGEIRMFAGNFEPQGWAFCDGQLLAISQNDALFSLLGTIYGGDGQTTFGLPDLRGRIPIHNGTGISLSSRVLGAKVGSESVMLTINQIPAHNHDVAANNFVGNSHGNAESVAFSSGTINRVYSTNLNNPQSFSSTTIASAGGGQSHNNLMPSLCVHFIISRFGIYPSRQ